MGMGKHVELSMSRERSDGGAKRTEQQVGCGFLPASPTLADSSLCGIGRLLRVLLFFIRRSVAGQSRSRCSVSCK